MHVDRWGTKIGIDGRYGVVVERLSNSGTRVLGVGRAAAVGHERSRGSTADNADNHSRQYQTMTYPDHAPGWLTHPEGQPALEIIVGQIENGGQDIDVARPKLNWSLRLQAAELAHHCDITLKEVVVVG